MIKSLSDLFTKGWDSTKLLLAAAAAFFAHYLFTVSRKEKAERKVEQLKKKESLSKVEKEIAKEKEEIDEEASKHTAREGIDRFLNGKL